MAVAVLVCDTAIELLARWGDFGRQTEAVLREAQYHGDVVCHQVCTDDPSQWTRVYAELEAGLGSVRALVLTGSRSDAFGPEPWIAALREFIVRVLGKVPVVGICFGHQLVATALGGRCARSAHGWEAGTTRIDFHGVDGDPVFAPLPPSIDIVQSHRDEVQIDHPQVRVVASSAQCAVQALYSPTLKLLTIQGHPEFTSEYDLALLRVKLELGVLSQAVYDLAVAQTAARGNDGVTFARVIVNFINSINV